MKKYKRGVTLIEIVVAMALIILVMSLAYMMYFYSYQSFYSEEQVSDIQSNARIVTDYVVDSTRNAISLELLSVTEANNQRSSGELYNYIYFASDGKVHCYYTDGSGGYSYVPLGTNIKLSDSSFSRIDDDTLKIRVVTIRNSNEYSSEVEITLSNFSVGESTESIPDTTTVEKAIRFRLP